MAYKCLECGNIFEDGEQTVWEEHHGLESPPYEKFSGCPLCHGDYEEVKPCVNCGNWHADNELYEGWCEGCLREQIDYEKFFAYCESNKKQHYLDNFAMFYLLGGMSCPEWVSPEFHFLMIDTYTRAVENAKFFESMRFIDDCIQFIMQDDGSIGRENFANWLNAKEVN